ncbi:MAG: hypothetical protein SFY69_10045 [Planctomycetota bacterium]|nr:hypothetical protein [Planctomycetota bacterium]
MRKITGSPSAAALAAVVGMACTTTAFAQTTFYSQNFDGAAPTNQSGDPSVVNACAPPAPAFTHAFPTGWTWNTCATKTYACRNPLECGTPSDCDPSGETDCATTEGVFEWEGWSITSKAFWGIRTDDQQRTQFTLGTGNVAVVDPDEWDDRGDPDNNCGFLNSRVTTPVINISTIDAGSLTFKFDSSWRPEGFDDANGLNNQTAVIRAIYTVGGVEQAPVQVMRWDSDNGSNAPGNFFKPDATNEMVVLTNASAGDGTDRFPGLNVPAGATAVRFEISMIEAANDWWWAIDNLSVDGTVGGSPTNVFAENFDAVPLLPPVHEIPPATCANTYCGVNTYTHTGPGGTSVTVASPASGGVPDWRGWSFVERSFWNCVEGNGTNFVNSSGRIAVADGDAFDDLASSGGGLDTTLATPAIDISGRSGNVLVLAFDSSWRWEAPQTASVVAEYNTGEVIDLVRWESVPGPFFKDDAEGELVARAMVVPAGATSVTLKFRYTGGNNWWWAIDNIRVFEGQATVDVAGFTPNQALMAVAPTYNFPACFSPWTLSPPTDWTSVWAPCGACPSECGRPEWRGWAFAFKDWWWQRVDNQRRSEFTLANGIVAIADPDEWDDFANGQAEFNAFLTTPAISLPQTVNSASLNFVSSWRDEAFDDGNSCSPLPPAAVITGISATNPAVVTTATPHGFRDGKYVDISGSNSAPTLNGRVRINVTSPTTFTVPAEVLTASSSAVRTIVSISTGNPATVTTSAPHGLNTGDVIFVGGTDSVPAVNGARTVTVTGPDTFTLPIDITTPGTSGLFATSGLATARNTNNQTAVIKATYSVGGVPQSPVEIFRWDSDSGRAASGQQIFIPPSPFFHNDNPNEVVNIPLSSIPAGAENVKFEIGLIESRNDWWWAIDNVVVQVNGSNVFTEDFENVPNLSAPPTELPPVAQCFYFSTVTEQNPNYAVDNSGLVNCTPGDDFYGWNAWTTEAWARAGGGGNRYQHGAPTVFVSDFDARGCDGTTILSSPDFPIGQLNPGSIFLSFRSGWDAAPGHNSMIQASFNGGTSWQTVLAWNPSNKGTTVDEPVSVNIPTDGTQNTVRFRFVDMDAGWWVVSNIRLTGVVGVPPCDPDFNQDGNVDQDDIFCLSLVVAGDPSCSGSDPDFNRDGNVDQDDISALEQVVAGSACP